MVIQRLQSLLLLVAAVLMGFFPWVPFGKGVLDGNELVLAPDNGYCVVFILGWVACALLLLTIFLFKNFRAQKLMLNLGLLDMAATAGFVAYYNIAASTNGYSVFWACGCWMLVAAIVFACWAKQRIRKDENLLKSYDRLR